MLRIPAEQVIDLHTLSFLLNEKSFEIVRSLIAGKPKRVCPVVDSRMETANVSSVKLKRLQRLDKFIFDERGSNDLHVGWPCVRGKFLDGTLVRCPLLFFPVSIVQENAAWIVKPREDAGITLNKSFLLAYSFFNKVRVDDELIDTSFDDFDSEATVFRTHLYQLLKDKIELNFNPETFTDELKSFEEFRKREFDAQHATGELKLYQEAVLGLFPQASSQLVPDYQHLIEQQVELESLFGSRNTTVTGKLKWDATIKEEKIYTPFAQDAYQEHALRLVKSGQSLVVQGPPGTGKSQLIANLMADGIASGKTILMVCQKRVALDVVYGRLQRAGLGNFLGLVHDFRNDRKLIFNKIARQIDSIDDYAARNRSVDSIQLERRFFQVCRRIDLLTEELEEFKSALFNEDECGGSAKELYLTSDPGKPFIPLRQAYHQFSFRTLDDFLFKLKKYCRYASVLETENHSWRNRKSFASYQLGDRNRIEKTIKSVRVTQEQINQKVKSILQTGLSFDECESLLQRKSDVDEMLNCIRGDAPYRYFQAMARISEQELSLLWLQNMERVSLNCFQNEGIEASLSTQDVAVCQNVLQERRQAGKNLFRLIRWELFSAHKFFLKRVLVNNGLTYNKLGLTTLERRIDNRLNLEHHLSALRSKSWLIELPPGTDFTSLKNWFTDQQNAVRAMLLANSLREIQNKISIQKLSRKSFIELFQSLFEALHPIPEYRQTWETSLSTYQIQQLLMNRETEQMLVKDLHEHFDLLCEFDSLKSTLTSVELEVVVKVNRETKSWDEATVLELFQNSLRLAWIEHLETKYPILRSVSTFNMDDKVQELQQMVKEKGSLSLQIVLLRARERTYEKLTFNRLNNRVTYRELDHQVTKKKKIWPVRKVISEFQEELFNLLPCWLASPEAVSAIFPMQEIFDLVIFDEASQCFAERGIPAMHRGKQVVVAGDSKQLKPFDLYQVRWEEESDEAALEIDSLLELSERFLPTVHLQNHYRSQTLPLIDFSNRFFYDGRLQLLPDRKQLHHIHSSVQFKKVQGIWENQTNVAEATAVVEEVFQLLKKFPEKEIGIITFNAPQQMLIMDVLEERSDLLKVKLPEKLMVKNIENVQGDEKDIVIFSIGYAPDAKNKMAMQFGSLNIVGGENRLNVAITRAREKVTVFTSIDPEQLKVDDLTNDGPKLLKKYLEYTRDVSNGNFRQLEKAYTEHRAAWYLNLKLGTLQTEQGTIRQAADIPNVDAMIVKEAIPVGVILTDDHQFYSSLTVKESFVYVPALLEQNNWPYLRVFSRNWWQDCNRIEQEITKFMVNLR